jgi:hypothetical protein
MWFRAETVRITFSLALFASVLFAPWWIALILAAALTLRFRAWEVIAAGILYDLLWLPGSVSFSSFEHLPLASIISLVLVFALEPLRRQLLLGPAIL